MEAHRCTMHGCQGLKFCSGPSHAFLSLTLNLRLSYMSDNATRLRIKRITNIAKVTAWGWKLHNWTLGYGVPH